MEQYIKKSDIVAEIERRINNLGLTLNEKEFAVKYELKDVLSFLDTLDVKEVGFDLGDPNGDKSSEYVVDAETLEVKDVDLEKESELIANEIMIGVQANKYHTNIYNTERNDFNHSHLWLAARKGIELGIKARKEE